MSTVYGVTYTKVLAGGTANGINRALLGEKKRSLSDTYEASALEIASTINIGKGLKSGDMIVGGSIYFDALGGSTTLIIGDSDDDNRYLTSTSTSSAGVAHFNAVDGINYVIGTNAGDTLILVTTAGAAMTGTIKVVVEYVSN